MLREEEELPLLTLAILYLPWPHSPWQVLREREEELSHLLHLLARGLAQPSDLEPFLKCLGAFRSLWSLALRPQLNRADAPPWLKARTCMCMCMCMCMHNLVQYA